jgi:hypothetical protein
MLDSILFGKPFMKTLLTLCLLLSVTFTSPTRAADTISGTVLEVKEVESYTYLRLKTKAGEVWAAVNRAPVKLGAQVSIENTSEMRNFESKALKKTFPVIVFGVLAGSDKEMLSAHAGVSHAPEAAEKIQVPKATGANAKTVSEIVTQAKDLKDKPVLVRGKVVKFNPGIMGKNWVHLRDGTGNAADNSNDILITAPMSTMAKPGDVVTVSGTVRTDKDFGAGYAYKVLIEDATLKQ